MMQHTREAMRKNRGLVVIILCLLVVYSIEPSISFMSDMCHRWILFFVERGAP